MPEPANHPWQAINAISGLLAALAVPIVLAVIGYRYTDALKEREIQGKFVELALNILKEPPKPEGRGVREWAIAVVNQYSGVPLSPEATQDLRSGVLITTQARVYLLAGSRSRAASLDSLRSALLAQGVNVVGQNAALQDETRASTPEVRYFSASDSVDASAIAARMRTWLRDSSVIARPYRDPSVKLGYIEIWLGR